MSGRRDYSCVRCWLKSIAFVCSCDFDEIAVHDHPQGVHALFIVAVCSGLTLKKYNS